ncbi:hypothetical protein FHP88_15625 [Sedimenticola selenatireducens]|uniref:Uncharacterized protein n=1 Tax=Sedimenticola selenatireducens TaxID=191960 RepID=A0A557S0C2_9GAMM|nr:hypothetical protein [Sedimenticola selenatireducens]TVO70882.1 hypothetical protein FHP88_15625 [Sedimenticola selenatireducens]
MDGIQGFLWEGGVGILGFFGGRYWEKRDQRSGRINDKIIKLSTDIAELSNLATSYYINPADERTTTAQTALIGSAFKRINVELHSLCLIAKLESSVFLDVITSFHQAITAEPYGAKIIIPINADDPRIIQIQCTEESFIRKLKSFEKA